MRDTTTLYARLPAALVRLINARAKALNSGYRSSKAYLEEGMRRFLARSPWKDSAPCFPTPRDVRTYSGGPTEWVAYNLILSRKVAVEALETVAQLGVSKPSFVLGALLWWLEQDLAESGVSPSKNDFAVIAAGHALPLWSAPGGEASTMAASTPRPKSPAKQERFKSANNLDIPVEPQTLAQIDEVIRGVEGRSKSGRLAAEELVTAIKLLGAEVNALGSEAEGTKIECVGQYVGEADPTLRYYTTSATIEYRNDEAWHLVKVLRKTVRAKEGGKTALQYSPRARVALGMAAGRSLTASVQEIPALIRKRFAKDDLHFWVGLMYQLVTEHDLDRDQAAELLKWRSVRSPDGAVRLEEAFEALIKTVHGDAWAVVKSFFPSGPITEDRISLATTVFVRGREPEASGDVALDGLSDVGDQFW
jgi:hypothetical protein